MAADTSKIASSLRAFRIGVNSHDRENPTHTAHGIGLNPFDLERLGFDEGEEIFPGITIQADSGVTGNFRVLCDGDHLEEREAEETEVVEAVSTQTAMIPVGVPEVKSPEGRRSRRVTAPAGLRFRRVTSAEGRGFPLVTSPEGRRFRRPDSETPLT